MFLCCSQSFVLVWFSVDVMNAITKSTGEERGFFFPSQQLYIVSHQGQPRKGSRQGLRGRNKIRVHSKTSLSMMCSPWFLIQLRPKCKGVALPTVVWDLEYHSLIKKMPHRCVYRPRWWKQLFNGGALFPGDPNLRQLDKS